MNIQILPNWFKKVALVVFIIGSIAAGGESFAKGFNDAINQSSYNYKSNTMSIGFIDIIVGGERNKRIFGVIAVLAVMGYMFSKEKVEDDYIQKIRLESYQLAFIIIVLIALGFYMFNKDFFYGVDDSVMLFLWLYLIVFFFKKRLA